MSPVVVPPIPPEEPASPRIRAVKEQMTVPGCSEIRGGLIDLRPNVCILVATLEPIVRRAVEELIVIRLNL